MLPSQFMRSDNPRGHMYRRSRRKRWPILIGLVAVLLGLSVVMKWWPGIGESSEASGELVEKHEPNADRQSAATPQTQPLANSTSKSTSTGPEKAQTPNKAAAKEDEPMLITMGAPTSPPAPPPSTPFNANAPSKAAATPTTNPRSNSANSSSVPGEPTSGETAASTNAEGAKNSHLPASPAKAATPQPQEKPTIDQNVKPEVNSTPAPTTPGITVPPLATVPATILKPDDGTKLATPPDPYIKANSSTVEQALSKAAQLVQQNRPLEARAVLNAALHSPQASQLAPTDAVRLRDELAKLNERLVFGPESIPGDPFTSTYQIESGDALAKLPRKLGLQVDWRLLQRVNKLSSPDRIRAGQRIKTVKGPFHAVVDKQAFRMDLYAGENSQRTYIRSFRVGLGEYGATPEGVFIVKPNSKLINPEWVNPRTSERFEANDPKNPIGEHWLGLIGISDNVRGLETYGIHGTIDPDSIGQQRSMGCVRMLAADVALVYEMLVENVSTVEIRGVEYP